MTWPKVRRVLFAMSIATLLASLGYVAGLWRASAHWEGLYGHINELQDWVGRGLLWAMTAFVLAMFGRGWKRIAMLLLASGLIYFWYGQANAV